MTNSPHRLTQLAAELPARYTTPLPHLARVRLLTGAHLDQLLAERHATQDTTARIRRRIMTRLHGLGLVTTLERRIGGARAGSAGHVYTLTPAGHRFLAILTGQPSPPRTKRSSTPGVLFVTHILAISDIYVRLIQASRTSHVTVPTFTTEPACWQLTAGGDYLKPDAYLVLATSTHQDCWWLENDQATEALPRIRAKCRTYLDFLTHSGVGPDHVPPRVLFSVPDTQRRNAIGKVITTLTEHSGQMICVSTQADTPTFLITELTQP